MIWVGWIRARAVEVDLNMRRGRGLGSYSIKAKRILTLRLKLTLMTMLILTSPVHTCSSRPNSIPSSKILNTHRASGQDGN